MKAVSLLLALLGALALVSGCTVRSDAPLASIDSAGQPTLHYFFTEG
ncbi:MAG: hypothetical protein IH587_06620 [Anaerolineae bacterium]|nr:hypothetical protein [Anaerolineae bacterium]